MYLFSRIAGYGPFLIVTAAVLWALDGIVRRSLYSLPPVTIVFYEHLIGALLLLPIVIAQFKKSLFTTRDYILIGVLSLLSGLLGTLWFTTALAKSQFIPFSVVFLLQQLEPVFAISTAIIFLREKLTRTYVIWALVALSAAFFATFPNGMVNFATGAGTVEAALYALGAAAAWGISTTISRKLLKDRPHTLIAGMRFITTTVFSLIAVFIMGQSASLALVGPTEVGRLVVIALSTGMVAMLLYYKGLKKTEVRIATLLELVFPMLAVSIDAFVFKTVLAPSQYLAAAILIFAIYRLGKLTKTAPPVGEP
jgi:drug/metabolite transporter (DMT)-like permease